MDEDFEGEVGIDGVGPPHGVDHLVEGFFDRILLNNTTDTTNPIGTGYDQ